MHLLRSLFWMQIELTDDILKDGSSKMSNPKSTAMLAI